MLLSQIRCSIPSLFFSAFFSCTPSGLKPSFRNTSDQNDMQPWRPGSRKALCHAFPFSLQKVYLCLRPWTRLSSPGESRLPQTWQRRGQLQHLAHEMAIFTLLSRSPSFLSLCCLIATFQWWLRPIGIAGLAPMVPHPRWVEHSWDWRGLCDTAGCITPLMATWSLCSTQYIFHHCGSLLLRIWTLLISRIF